MDAAEDAVELVGLVMVAGLGTSPIGGFVTDTGAAEVSGVMGVALPAGALGG